MKILAIESSCDDTAVAITEGREILASVIHSQVDEHTLYGGVVPEIASRRHIENIGALYEKALADAELKCAVYDFRCYVRGITIERLEKELEELKAKEGEA